MKKFLLFFALFLVTGIFYASGQQRNCSTMENLDRLVRENAEVAARMAAIETRTRQVLENGFYSTNAGNNIITIPVVVHVIYKSSSQNISDAQIQSQIDVLNEDFRKLNADAGNTPSEFSSLAADVQVQFELASIDPNGNTTNGITRKYSSKTTWGTNDDMKKSTKGGVNPWDTGKYLNMWICNIGGGTLGYAQFPGGPSATDGVVISPQYFGRTGDVSAPFDKGRTTTHEVGHYLNLRHIWGDGGCGASDYVNDTPDADGPNYSCPSYPKSSCGSNDMFMNYMDYVDDACMYLFTSGQKNRMRALFASGGARESLVNGSGDEETPVYCTSKGNSVSDEWIANVTVGELVKSSGANSGYADFTGFSASLAIESSYNVSLTPGFANSQYNEYWKIWIDLNGDKDFDDAGELIFDASGLSSSTVNGTLTIPSSAIPGATRMRVTMKYNGAPSPCETFSYGEVEDYTVNIASAGTAACSNAPSGLNPSAVTTTSFSLNWDEVAGAVAYDVQLRTAGTSTWGSYNAASNSINITGNAPATTYEYRVRTNCSGGISSYSSIATVTTEEETAPTYCSSKGNSTADEWIQKVTLGSINHSSGNNGGYADFTNKSTNLTKGKNYSITIRPGWTSTVYREAYQVWIDYNQDGDFNDSGELVYSRSRTTNSSITGSFTVPSAARNGTTRMRVSMKYNAKSGACEVFSYGEVEDYTVNFGSASREQKMAGNFKIDLYPNPADIETLVQFEIPGEATDITLAVFDVRGKEVIRQQWFKTNGLIQHALNTQTFDQGIYFISIEGQGFKKVEKLIIR